MKREVFLVTAQCDANGPTLQRLIETRNKTYAGRIVAKSIIRVTRPTEDEMIALIADGIEVERDK